LPTVLVLSLFSWHCSSVKDDIVLCSGTICSWKIGEFHLLITWSFWVQRDSKQKVKSEMCFVLLDRAGLLEQKTKLCVY
jgi:hypothetical protein